MVIGREVPWGWPKYSILGFKVFLLLMCKGYKDATRGLRTVFYEVFGEKKYMRIINYQTLFLDDKVRHLLTAYRLGGCKNRKYREKTKSRFSKCDISINTWWICINFDFFITTSNLLQNGKNRIFFNPLHFSPEFFEHWPKSAKRTPGFSLFLTHLNGNFNWPKLNEKQSCISGKYNNMTAQTYIFRK